MPIISIPTSIAGISVPGITSNGPLGLLYSNPFKTDTLYYPRDLNSSTKGHVVQFTIYEVTPVGYETLSNLKIPTKQEAKDAWKQAGNAIENFNFESAISDITSGVVSKFNDLVDSISNLPGSQVKFESQGLNFQPKRNKPIGQISLYMPDTLDFQYPVSYDDSVSAVGALGSTVGAAIDKLVPGKGMGKIGQAITSAIETAGPIAQLGLQKAGYAVNPQLQVLFQGIGFREFSMNFTFTPYSKEEAKMVEKIIQSFRKNAAPHIETGAGGMFFVPPASFGIKFLFNGAENTHLNRIKDSVITNIDVNYAPQGWSSHDDGAPVQTTLSLTFKELTLVDSTQIQNGY
jgi:hypothetical protein